MKKDRILSLLAACAILIAALALSPVFAEGGGEINGQNPGDEQYIFVSVPSGGSVAEYFDLQFDESFKSEGNENTPNPANEAAVNEPEPSSTVRAIPEQPKTSAPVDEASQKVSNFEMDGKALVKYRGNEATVFIPEGVTVIRGGAFAGNTDITTVYLPDSVKEIEGGAFENCSKLQNVIISGSSKLSTIGAYAFAGCRRLNISFSLSVENVSSRAFPPELIITPTPRITPTPKPTATMKPTPMKPSNPYDPIPGNGEAVPGSLRITLQPFSVYANEGDIVTFYVVAEGSGTIYYQWMRSKDGVNWVKIENNGGSYANASANVLSFKATAAHSGYQFKCIVTDGVNTVESDIVFVIVDTQGASPAPDAPDPWENPGSVPVPDGPINSSVPYLWARQISGHAALIKWTEMPSAIGYELYRYSLGQDEKREESFVLLGTFTGTSYTDTDLDFTKYTYTYSLKAVLSISQNGDPVTTDYSNPAEAEALSAPSSVSAWQETETTVRITWSPSKYATSYMVTRSKNDDQFYIIAQSLTGLEYVDRNLDFSRNTYRYKVWAEMTVPGSDEPIRRASQPVQAQEFFSIGREFEIDKIVYTITSDGAVVTAYKGNASSLTIPEKIQNDKYTVVAIGPNVFWGNKTLKSISLPKTIRVIETGAFAYCDTAIVIK